MNLAPETMKEVFDNVEGPYALGNKLKLKSRKIQSLRYSIETASFVDARVWNSLPIDFKQCKSLELFKPKIKNWIPETALANFVNLTSNESTTCKLLIRCVFL